jgi:hypothetical protein
MTLQSELPSSSRGVNSGIGPPRGFIAAAMHLAMMTTAERDRELIANFAA